MMEVGPFFALWLFNAVSAVVLVCIVASMCLVIFDCISGRVYYGILSVLAVVHAVALVLLFVVHMPPVSS